MSFCDPRRTTSRELNVFRHRGSFGVHIETVARKTFAAAHQARDFGGRHIR
jgi:hypothetical protein